MGFRVLFFGGFRVHLGSRVWGSVGGWVLLESNWPDVELAHVGPSITGQIFFSFDLRRLTPDLVSCARLRTVTVRCVYD